MKKMLLATFVALAFGLAASAQNSVNMLGQTIPTVSVNGSAQLKIEPDVIYIAITLDESDTKGKVSLEEQRRNMISALKKCDVDIEKQLSVKDMESAFFRRRGSLASTQYELKVASANAARKIFEALDDAGIPNARVTGVTNSRLDEYRADARAAAIRNAQERARQLAEAIGQSIGACYEINDYTSDAQPRLYRNMVMTKNAVMADGVAEEEAEPEVEFKEIEINYNVSAKFVLDK